MGTIKHVYIIHGWTYSTDKWQALEVKLKQASIEPVMLQVPGLTSDSAEVWDLDKYVEWLNNSTSHDRAPLVLVGHSNGGRIAMAFAIRYPQRVAQLILIDSAGVYHDDLAIKIKRQVFGIAARLGKRLTNSSKARALLYKAARARDYHEASPNMRATMANLLESDKQLAINQIKASTTIIWGEQDSVTPSNDGKTIQKFIQGSQLHIIPGARHAPFYTHATAVAHIITETLT